MPRGMEGAVVREKERRRGEGGREEEIGTDGRTEGAEGRETQTETE